MSKLATLDIGIIIGFLISVIVIGAWAAKRASKSAEDFFLSGRSMPWWLLGVSMVACTFSCDTPNLVTDIVRTQGVAGNWAWWAFLLTGMLTVFVYAKLWRRSNLSTDLGFYEIRYAGTPAKALRGFRAVYLGLVFNIIVMGTVSGDIHDIGKNVCVAMLRGARYKVIDIGNDVSPEDFVRYATENSADAIGASSLMTTTLVAQKKLVETMDEFGCKALKLFGGAPCTEEWVNSIGGDGYSSNGHDMVLLVNKVLKK